MVLDSHQHFWKYDPVAHSWIDDSMKNIRRDFLPQDLRPVLEENQVDGCIAVQADQTEKETEFLLQCAETNPFVKGVVGWIDLRADNAGERLEYFSRNPLLKGIRHIVQGEPLEFMLGQGFQNGIEKLSAFGLTYDILIYHFQLDPAIQLVEKFPNQKFVLDHIAKPRISEGMDLNWKKNIEQLGKRKNVCCKISGMVTETNGFQWQKDDFTKFLDAVVKAFGTDRLMFGSDWPVCLVSCEYEEVLGIVKNYFSDFTGEEQDKIMGLNAARFYNVE